MDFVTRLHLFLLTQCHIGKIRGLDAHLIGHDIGFHIQTISHAADIEVIEDRVHAFLAE